MARGYSSACSIRAVTTALKGADVFASDDEVTEVLRQCAEDLIDTLILHHLRSDINSALVGAIRIGGDPKAPNVAASIMSSVEASLERINVVGTSLTIEEMAKRAEAHRLALSHSLQDGAWIKDFPGREIIRRYIARQLGGKIDYLFFANSVLDKMVEKQAKPVGMHDILNDILTR